MCNISLKNNRLPEATVLGIGGDVKKTSLHPYGRGVSHCAKNRNDVSYYGVGNPITCSDADKDGEDLGYCIQDFMSTVTLQRTFSGLSMTTPVDLCNDDHSGVANSIGTMLKRVHRRAFVGSRMVQEVINIDSEVEDAPFDLAKKRK